MSIQLYNTLSRAKEELTPIRADAVGMYVCGPTVYDLIHIGNARPLVVFDVLYRVLRHRYGNNNVTYVRNITDIDDKIIDASSTRGIDIDELTQSTITQFHADADALGCLKPDIEPRATQHIREMIALITQLLSRGHAYERDGHVLFHVPSFPDYGRLSGNSREAIVAGARVDIAPYKKDAADFVLWKPSDEILPGWDSPWGRGRPGWHLECSAMSMRHLGPEFDIHGGGRDLVFPHHENEIAQTCAANPGCGFANVWMHNGYLTVDGEKMAKSAGNFHTVKDLLEHWHGEVMRLALLSTHYRQPLDFSEGLLLQARNSLNRFYNAVATSGADQPVEIPDSVRTALEDDLNTPLAVSMMHGLADKVFKGDAAAGGLLLAAGEQLGILAQRTESWLHGTGEDTSGIDALVHQRTVARCERRFSDADRIRDKLSDMGIELQDSAQGTTWRRL